MTAALPREPLFTELRITESRITKKTLFEEQELYEAKSC